MGDLPPSLRRLRRTTSRSRANGGECNAHGR